MAAGMSPDVTESTHDTGTRVVLDRGPVSGHRRLVGHRGRVDGDGTENPFPIVAD